MQGVHAVSQIDIIARFWLGSVRGHEVHRILVVMAQKCRQMYFIIFFRVKVFEWKKYLYRKKRRTKKVIHMVFMNRKSCDSKVSKICFLKYGLIDFKRVSPNRYSNIIYLFFLVYVTIFNFAIIIYWIHTYSIYFLLVSVPTVTLSLSLDNAY